MKKKSANLKTVSWRPETELVAVRYFLADDEPRKVVADPPTEMPKSKAKAKSKPGEHLRLPHLNSPPLHAVAPTLSELSHSLPARRCAWRALKLGHEASPKDSSGEGACASEAASSVPF